MIELNVTNRLHPDDRGSDESVLLVLRWVATREF